MPAWLTSHCWMPSFQTCLIVGLVIVWRGLTQAAWPRRAQQAGTGILRWRNRGVVEAVGENSADAPIIKTRRQQLPA